MSGTVLAYPGVLCTQGVRGSSPLSSTPTFPQVRDYFPDLRVDLHEAFFR